jgi:ADP-sugar diphosphatase
MKQIHTGSRSGEITITGSPEYGREHFLGSKLFVNWRDSLNSDLEIRAIRIVSVSYKSNTDPIFAKLNVTAYYRGNQIIPDVVFLRGGSVAILPILVSAQTGAQYVVFTKQVRLPVGDELVEIPAGMLDGDRNFIGVAAKEFREEVGISITPSDLIDLTPIQAHDSQPFVFPKAIAVSPGACDETMNFYLFRKKMPQAEIDVLKGKLTGNKEEHESICLMVVELEKAPHLTRDGKFFSAYGLAKLQGVL